MNQKNVQQSFATFVVSFIESHTREPSGSDWIGLSGPPDALFYTPGCALHWMFLENLASFAWDASWNVCSIWKCLVVHGLQILLGWSLTISTTLRKELMFVRRFRLMCSLTHKILSTVNNRCFYELVPCCYIGSYAFTTKAHAFACLICAKSWHLSEQSSGSKSMSRNVHANKKRFY